MHAPSVAGPASCAPLFAEPDHVTPRSQGGLGTPDNLVLACKDWNSARGDLDYETFKNLVARLDIDPGRVSATDALRGREHYAIAMRAKVALPYRCNDLQRRPQTRPGSTGETPHDRSP
ncbi:MAG: HNH endonuclease [Alphaproteobacteria bacterium]